MTFTVTLQDTRALSLAIHGAVAAEVAKLPINVDAKALEAEHRAENVNELCRKWFEDGESLTVEIDTEAKTCRVVPL